MAAAKKTAATGPGWLGSKAPLLQQRRVLIVGLAKSGRAAIALAKAHGATVAAFDQKPEGELAGVAELKKQGVALHLGVALEAALAGVDLVVVSPGVPLSTEALVAAEARGVPVMGEVELAWALLPKGTGPLVGVTGTNGKSTTTALLGELFARGGKRTFVGGNLGRPLSEAAMAPAPYELLAVELSSFQLEGVDQARFHGAAILNLTPDHLDRYPTLEAYGEAKARIFAAQTAQDFAVVNADDPGVMKLVRAAKAPVYGFSLKARVAAKLAGRASPTVEGFALELGRREPYVLSNTALRGAHNLKNAMAAALLARLSGISAAAVQEGLDGFPGLPHRLERVRVLDGVEWVNDSKATNIDSTLVALQAFPRGVWLIAGGKGKGAPYRPLVEASRPRVKGVLTIGQDAGAIAQAFEGELPVHPCETLDRAVAKAHALATPGDTVLLSPACASYDQFQNFEDRGDTFKRLVMALAST